MSQKIFHKVRPTAAEDKVPVSKRIAYGTGQFTDHIGTDTLMNNINPIFNVALHMDPRLLGVSIAIMRLWDAVTDPFVGAFSDNARTRWGRRRPLMLVGAVGAGLSFPLIWFVPGGLASIAIFAWLTVFSILFFTCQTLFSIPWTALGFELTPDYNERTRVMEIRAYIGHAAGFLIPWTYALTQLPIFGGHPLVGARWMGIGMGGLLILSGIVPVIFLRERFFKKAKTQGKISVWESVVLTLKNRPFIAMILITFFTLLGSMMVGHLGFYIGLYYLFDGDTVKQGVLTGVTGNAAVIISIASVFVLNRVSMRIGKRKTLLFCQMLLFLSGFAKWFLYIPEYPWLSVAVHLFTAPAAAGFWLLITSIKADICDDDELVTGYRREGAIGAASVWIIKLTKSATAVLAGVVLTLTGYQASAQAAQTDGVINAMRLWFCVIPSASALVSIVLLWWFPITEERARETRRLLEARRGKL